MKKHYISPELELIRLASAAPLASGDLDFDDDLNGGSGGELGSGMSGDPNEFPMPID